MFCWLMDGYSCARPWAWWAAITEGERAAWFQAYASVGALAIAIFAPMWHTNRLERAQTKAQRRAVLAIARHAYSFMDEAAQLMPAHPGLLPYLQGRITTGYDKFIVAINALRSIRLVELRDVDLAPPILELASLFDEFRVALTGVHHAMTSSGEQQGSPAVQKATKKALDIAMEAKRHVSIIAATV